jgi:5-methylthioadenosine/S-adenosylhomocysteine deaminase
MVERGVNVGLGCDSGNYSDAFDIAHQAYLAATIHREARGGTPVVSAAQAFGMATMGGARAMGISSLVGSIEPGKRADIVVHDGQRPEWHPLHDPIASLIYAARSSSVRDVIIDGRLVLEGGAFTTIDEEAAYRSIDHHALDLSRRMGWESFATRT